MQNNDINKQVVILKNTIQQVIVNSDLPISIIHLILSECTLQIEKLENEYFNNLATEEKQREQKKEKEEENKYGDKDK